MKPILYIKPGCPWCQEALNYFAKQDLALDVRDVTSNAEDRRAMADLTGQSKTPTFVYGEFVVADFDVSEFQDALKKAPTVAAELGLN